MTYEELPIIRVRLDDLLLDLENYRIPTKRDDEAGALKYLFESEDVLEAADSILRNGYFDNEVPIVTSASESGRGAPYTVVEGNRRVSALKALQDPTIIPGHESKIRALLKRYRVETDNLPTAIRVIVTPTKAVAAPHVARLHTGISKRRWSLDQQATFYYSLLDGNTTVDDVKAQYPSVNVTRFMKMAVIRRFVAAAQFADQSLRDYAASDELKMSVFEYAYQIKEIASAIGVHFDKDGMLVPGSLMPRQIGATLPEEKLRALEYLLTEFRAGRFNTRSPEFKKNSAELQSLVDRLNGVSTAGAGVQGASPADSTSSPSTKQESSSVSGGSDAGGSGDNSSSSGSSGGAGSRGPNHPDTKDTLDLSGLDYEGAPVNLKQRYIELRAISLSKFPNAAAILMRSVLETTIKVHFEAMQRPVKGELRSVMKQVAKRYGNEKRFKQVIDMIESGGAGKEGSIQWFNLVAHSPDSCVRANDVRNAWYTVNPLLRHLLRSPSPQGSSTTF